MRQPVVAGLLGALLAGAVPLVVGPRSAPLPVAPPPPPPLVLPTGPALDNRAAYIPPQCYALTRDGPDGRTHNGCFACHQASQPPNYVDDADVQTSMSLPRFALQNRWDNLLHPPPPVAISDEDLLAWVRRSNYRGAFGCAFHADERGWDRDADGRTTGWRAYAFAPMPGRFWPTNSGSAGDAFIRLPEAYRKDAEGKDSLEIYALNLAIVEAYLRRADVPIPPTDEKALSCDLDGDGRLGRARKVAFVWPPIEGRPFHYVGQAAALDPAKAGWPAAGVYPTGSEIVHSLRYLDVADGKVRMAARMKEVRYMRKERWLTYSDLDLRGKAEMREKAQDPDKLKLVLIDEAGGVATGSGWRMRGFIEDANGELRAQTIEETAACIGCHGGVGATTDSTFSFPRKLGGAAPGAGWYHWQERGLAGIAEPRRSDGRGEYAVWLEAVGGGDDFLSNRELDRLFRPDGTLRPALVRALARDISVVAVPSPGRALALDRAYLALVKAQSFPRGRDVVLDRPRVQERIEQDAPTGIHPPLGR